MAWKPGESGNPNGRGKDKICRQALMMALLEEGADMPALRRIAKKLIAVAESGESWAAKEIFDRLDGKAVQPIAGDDASDPIKTTHIERLIIEHTVNPDSESIPASTSSH